MPCLVSCSTNACVCAFWTKHYDKNWNWRIVLLLCCVCVRYQLWPDFHLHKCDRSNKWTNERKVRWHVFTISKYLCTLCTTVDFLAATTAFWQRTFDWYCTAIDTSTEEKVNTKYWDDGGEMWNFTITHVLTAPNETKWAYTKLIWMTCEIAYSSAWHFKLVVPTRSQSGCFT